MLESRSLFGLLVILLLTNVSCDSSNGSGDESDDASKDAGSQDASDAVDADSVDTPEDAGPDAETGGDSTEMHCPNGKTEDEWLEECDDGNYFDNDGCTQLCTFSCEDHEDCDDLNDCNGKEKCIDHACERGEWAENETVCGSNKSCFEGLCREDICGDKVVNEGLGEICDDGNKNDDDDCRNDCTYGCTSDDDCRDGDPCAGTTTCDEESHACSGGSTLDDETLCETTDIKDGWCMKAVCVPTDCGNGKKEGNEECDDGADNGTSKSSCSVRCKIVDCGNGTIEGEEECDDGNEENFDSCDENCRAEIYYRWNVMEILSEPSPNWCVHAGMNAFAIAFPGLVPVKVGELTIEVDILAQVNERMAAVFEDCMSNRLIQVLDLDDPSFQTSDDEVSVAFQFGELASGQTCENGLDVDSELNLFGDYIEDGVPIFTLPAIQRPGLLQSANPIDIPAQDQEEMRAGALYDFKFQWQMDIEHLSTPSWLERDDDLEPVKLPETMGVNPDPDEPYHPAGRLCAAMSMDGMKKAKVVEGTENALCCSSPESANGIRKYRACPADDPDGDCESEADIVTNGCVICVKDFADIEGFDVNDMVSTDCGGGDFGDCSSLFEVVHPSPPDIDTDGDGENDALSIVLAVEGVRVRSLGAKD